MATYRAAGSRVTVDDLGAGDGSLNLLNQSRPADIGLDMALVRNVDHDPYLATIAVKLLGAARVPRVRTIAGGVETEAERSWLRRHGAGSIQGFLLARPGSPAPCPGRATTRASPTQSGHIRNGLSTPAKSVRRAGRVGRVAAAG